MKHSIKFSLRVSNNIRKPIRCRITIPNKRIEYSIGYSVLEKDWDNVLQRVKKTEPNYNIINLTISNIESSISQHIAIAIARGEVVTKNDILNIINKQGKQEDIRDVFSNFLKEKSAKSLSANAIRNYRMAFRNLLSLDEHVKLSDIDDEFIMELIKQLVGKNYKNSTISLVLILLKSFLYWAKEKDIYNNNAFTQKYTLKGAKDKDIIFLETDELKALMNVHCKTETEQSTLDLFLMSCFTGLRYSDVTTLTQGNIRDDKIYVKAQKTNNFSVIELNNYSRSLLEKYHYKPPYVPSTTCSKLIKKLAKRAGINNDVTISYYSGNQRIVEVVPKYSVISFHTARKTFVTSALYLEIPSEVIMKWTGHKNLISFKHYAEIVDSLKKKNMDKFNTILD